MSLSKQEILNQLSELSSPSDIECQLEALMGEASELNDSALLQKIFDKAKKLAKKNYKANIVLWTCLALFLDKKREALSLFIQLNLTIPKSLMMSTQMLVGF